MKKTCLDCKHCLTVDHGYSNWTVEGTTVYCLKDKNPSQGFDRWYGQDSRLSFAEKCSSFKAGDHESLDVDRECWEDLSEQAKRFLGNSKW